MDEYINVIAKKIIKTFDELSENPDMVGMLFSASNSCDERNCDRSHAKLTVIYRSIDNIQKMHPILINNLNFIVNVLQYDIDDLYSLIHNGKIEDIADLYYSCVIYDCQNDIKDAIETIGINHQYVEDAPSEWHLSKYTKNDLVFQKLLYDEILNLTKRRIPVIIKRDLLNENVCLNCHADNYERNQDGNYTCLNCGTVYLLNANEIIDDMINMKETKYNMYRIYDKRINNQTTKEEIIDYIFKPSSVKDLSKDLISGFMKKK